MKKTFISFFIIILLFGCAKTNKDNIQDQTTETENTESDQNLENETAEENDSVFTIAVLTEIRIRDNHSTSGEIVGHVYPREYYEVLETVKSEGYSWYRIDDNQWIADNGKWLEKLEKPYPIKMTYKEIEEFLKRYSGTWKYNKNRESEIFIIFNDDYSSNSYDILQGQKKTLPGGWYSILDVYKESESTYCLHVHSWTSQEYYDWHKSQGYEPKVGYFVAFPCEHIVINDEDKNDDIISVQFAGINKETAVSQIATDSTPNDYVDYLNNDGLFYLNEDDWYKFSKETDN